MHTTHKFTHLSSSPTSSDTHTHIHHWENSLNSIPSKSMAKVFYLTIIAALSMIFISTAAFADSGNSPFIVAHKRVSQRKISSDLERVSVSIDIYNAGSEYSPLFLSLSLSTHTHTHTSVFVFVACRWIIFFLVKDGDHFLKILNSDTRRIPNTPRTELWIYWMRTFGILDYFFYVQFFYFFFGNVVHT